jgi:Kef-type K+ transport system membrane component KefB
VGGTNLAATAADSRDFYAMAGILALAGAGGLLASRLRQPVLVAYIIVGIAVGPFGTGWVSPGEQLEVLARLGIAVLLFLVGLKLDVHLIRQTGPVALATGLGQIVFTSVVGFLIALLLGLEPVTALYVAIALTFSSTIIIVKLLSDKRELEELHGRIAIGFLIVQDIVVIALMIGLTAFGSRRTQSLPAEVAWTLGKGGILLAGTVVAARVVLPRVLAAASRSSEVLMLAGVAWAVALAAASDALGFSTEIGAFIAGVAVASTPFREAMSARLVSLRDFLLLFFFLDLGATLEFAEISAQAVTAAVLSLFVLVGNPVIVMIIMGVMRYPARVSFLAGLTVAQISEFSLILAALGYSLGHIDRSTLGLVTLVGLVTISASTYLILSSKPLYARLASVLAVFERARTRAPPVRTPDPVDVLVMGLGRLGGTVAARLTEAGLRVLGVDFDPEAVARWQRDGGGALLGDVESGDLLDALPLEHARWVVCTIPEPLAGRALLHELRARGYRGAVALTATNGRDHAQLRDAGADVVLYPQDTAAEVLAARITAPSGYPSTARLEPREGEDAILPVDDITER